MVFTAWFSRCYARDRPGLWEDKERANSVWWCFSSWRGIGESGKMLWVSCAWAEQIIKFEMQIDHLVWYLDIQGWSWEWPRAFDLWHYGDCVFGGGRKEAFFCLSSTSGISELPRKEPELEKMQTIHINKKWNWPVSAFFQKHWEAGEHFAVNIL